MPDEGCMDNMIIEAKPSFLHAPHLSIISPHLSIIAPHLSIISPHLSIISPHLSIIAPHLSIIAPHLSIIADNRPTVPHVGNVQVAVHHQCHQRGTASRQVSVQQLRLALQQGIAEGCAVIPTAMLAAVTETSAASAQGRQKGSGASGEGAAAGAQELYIGAGPGAALGGRGHEVHCSIRARAFPSAWEGGAPRRASRGELLGVRCRGRGCCFDADKVCWLAFPPFPDPQGGSTVNFTDEFLREGGLSPLLAHPWDPQQRWWRRRHRRRVLEEGAADQRLGKRRGEVFRGLMA